MNTLPRAIAAQILNDSETYAALRAHWSGLIQSDRKHALTVAHHLLYLAFLGKDWRKAFTPPTNRRKLENGAFEGWVLFRALRAIHSVVASPELLAPMSWQATSREFRDRSVVFCQISLSGVGSGRPGENS